MSNARSLDDWTPTQHSEPSDALDLKHHTHPADYVVLVIGAQRNIGMFTALRYAMAGVKTILLTARDASTLGSTIAFLEGEVKDESVRFMAMECDPASNESVRDLAAAIESKYERLDVVVLNAGYSGDVILDLTTTPPDSFATAANVNYLGTFHVMHHLIPLLLSSPSTASGAPPGKSLVCIGSFAAAITQGIIANAQYCVSKLAQARLCEYAAKQFGDRGLLVGNVHPGAVNTDMARESKGAEQFMKYCTDDPKLAGAFLVWLTSRREEHMWLSGRLISATWDVTEVVANKKKIVSQDLFKARFTI